MQFKLINLQNEFPFMKPNSISSHIVYCGLCKCDVDISNSSRSNIKALQN